MPTNNELEQRADMSKPGASARDTVHNTEQYSIYCINIQCDQKRVSAFPLYCTCTLEGSSVAGCCAQYAI